MTLSDLPRAYYETLAVIFGLLWGSFLNVVIYRVPREMSVVRPPSHCPGCGKPIKAYDNIPIVSYAILFGRARCCKAKMSIRYPIVEAIGGVLSLAIIEAIIMPMAPTTPLLYAVAVYLVDLAFALTLVSIAFIDIEWMIVPEWPTYVGTVAGIATASFRGLAFWEAIVGAVAGFAVVRLIGLLYAKLRGGGKLGMGRGDANLLMVAGAWFGWKGALTVLGSGAIQGTIILLGLMLLGKKIDDPEQVKREREELKRELEEMTPEEREEALAEISDDVLAEDPDGSFAKSRVAFGPFLMLAMLEMLFLGQDIFPALIDRLVTP